MKTTVRVSPITLFLSLLVLAQGFSAVRALNRSCGNSEMAPSKDGKGAQRSAVAVGCAQYGQTDEVVAGSRSSSRQHPQCGWSPSPAALQQGEEQDVENVSVGIQSVVTDVKTAVGDSKVVHDGPGTVCATTETDTRDDDGPPQSHGVGAGMPEMKQPPGRRSVRAETVPCGAAGLTSTGDGPKYSTTCNRS